MKILSDLRFYVVVATLSFTGLLVNYVNNLDELKKTKEELIKCQTDRNYIPGGDITSSRGVGPVSSDIDSIRDELFIERVESGRHELTRDEIFAKYPKIKKEYEEFYNHQTE